MEDVLNELNGELSKAKYELVTAKEESAAAKEEALKAKKEALKAKEKAVAAEELSNKLNVELVKAAKEAAEATKEAAEATKEASEATKEAKEAKEKTAEAKEKTAEAEELSNKLNEQLVKATKEAAEAKKEATEATKEAAEAKEKAAEAKEKATEAKEKATEAEELSNKLNEQLKNAADDTSAALIQKEAAEQETVEVKEKIVAAEEKTAAKQQLLNQMNIMVDTLNRRLEVAEEKIAAAERETAAAKRETAATIQKMEKATVVHVKEITRFDRIKIMLEKTITQQGMTIRSLKGDVKECSVGSKWLSKSRKNKLDKTNTALDAKSQELDAKSQELEEAKAQLEAKNQSTNNFVEAMRLYAVEEKKEEDKYTVSELWGKYEGPINCNRLTIREKIIYNTLAKRYNKKYPGYSQYDQLTDTLTLADIAYVEELKEERKKCVRFLALNGENGCLDRIENLQYKFKKLQNELKSCNIKSTFNSDDSSDSDSSDDDLSAAASGPVYKEFNIEGYGWTRVLYKTPRGKTQGKGGWYYGVAVNDNSLVHVRGQTNIRMPRGTAGSRYAGRNAAKNINRLTRKKKKLIF